MKQWWENNYAYMASLGMESVSGTGSTLDATKAIREELPSLFIQYDIKSVCDVPCGDFNWMQYIKLARHIEYIGIDIVEENVRRNSWKTTATDNFNFELGDITTDPLPTVDLIFCRDCLVHFSDEDIWKALKNIAESGSKYLMTTTFINRTENTQILTGGWRPLNLQIAPFFFPEPLAWIDEKCEEQGGIYADKKLGLWEVSGILS